MRSFENEISHLHPEIKEMWQQPLKKIPKDPTAPWYKKEQLGHNPLEKLMGRLSEKIGLSDHYTNHCIRVTGATNLTRAKFTASQIMAVMGHKSIQSLAIYQKVHDDERMRMGISLMYRLLKPQEALKIRETIKQQEQNEENEQNEPPVKRQAIESPPPSEPNPVLALPQLQIQPQNHALDPANTNILPLEDALVSYQPPEKEQNVSDTPDFDLMQIVADIQSDQKG